MFSLLAELLRSIDFPKGPWEMSLEKPLGMGPEKPYPVNPINPGYNDVLGKQVYRQPGGDMPPSAYDKPTGSSGGNPVPPPPALRVQDAQQASDAGGPRAIKHPWQKFLPGAVMPPPGDEAAMSSRLVSGNDLRDLDAQASNRARLAKKLHLPHAPLNPVVGPGFTKGYINLHGEIAPARISAGGPASVEAFVPAKGMGPEYFKRQPEFRSIDDINAARQRYLNNLASTAIDDRLAPRATAMVTKAVNAVTAAQLAAKVAESAMAAREKQRWYSTVGAVRSQRLKEGADPQAAERDAIYEADRQLSNARFAAENHPEAPVGRNAGSYGSPPPRPSGETRNDSYGDVQEEPVEEIDSTGRPVIIYRKKTYGIGK